MINIPSIIRIIFTISISFFFLVYSGVNGFFIFVEILFLILLINFIASKKNKLLKFIGVSVCFLLSVVYGSQLYSVYRSGGYLSPMALANAKTGFTTNISYELSVVFAFLFFIYFILLRLNSFDKKSYLNISIFILLFGFFIFIEPEKADNVSVGYMQSPFNSLVHSYIDVTKNIKALNNEDFKLASEGFRKDKNYDNEFLSLPFLEKNKNIIVVFTEGLSSRWFKDENENYYGLMPKIKKLSNNTINFKNYYNHTAATFRGLRGQLKSSHQYMGGWMGGSEGLGASGATKYFNPFQGSSLHESLMEYGYEPYFFVSQQNHLNEMLENMNFEEVFGRDKLHAMWGDGVIPEVLSDQEFFQFTLNTLERKKHKFISFLYNFDTHNGLDGSKKFRDGNNEVLNRFHTYDEVFGDFLENFKKSKLHENTILIFTADHSTFPDKHAKSADNKMLNHFVDEIPLMIYYKGVEKLEIDANYQTSISFAPTILNLLEIKNQDNYFFGCSIFDECQNNYFGSIGNFYYKVDENGLSGIDANVPEQRENFGPAAKLIYDYQLINKYHKFN